MLAIPRHTRNAHWTHGSHRTDLSQQSKVSRGSENTFRSNVNCSMVPKPCPPLIHGHCLGVDPQDSADILVGSSMCRYFFGLPLTSLCVFYGKALGSIVHTSVAKFGRILGYVDQKRKEKKKGRTRRYSARHAGPSSITVRLNSQWFIYYLS